MIGSSAGCHEMGHSPYVCVFVYVCIRPTHPQLKTYAGVLKALSLKVSAKRKDKMSTELTKIFPGADFFA